ncbi:MAG TPA: tripartite tricarboxylate transporter substrate binding protein [Burkholderiales bacterium]|nr:tripartite tricarboxylate transporter substrate binding protein [Burkholderiales bacterium]
MAIAQWKPDRNVEFVIGTGAGGVFDRTARVVQHIWKEHRLVDVSSLVINRPGAGQALALTYLNQHAGSGHYLSVVSGIIFSNHLTGKTSFAYTDFTPVAVLFNEATVFAVKADGPYKSARDLFERLRRDPYGPSFAVGSTLGSATHIAAALTVKAAGGDVRKMKAVVFNSSGDSVTALLGGHVDVVPAAASLVLPHVQSGRLRLIAVATPQRLGAALAEVPTWKEINVDAVAPNWRGVIGPKGMTPEQVAYWENVFARTVKTPEWKSEVATNVWEDVFLIGRDARKYLDADNATVKAMLSELGLAK